MLNKDCFWTAYVCFCRFFAFLISLALWGLGAETVAFFSIVDGVLILVAALIVSFLEAVFAIRIMLSICPRERRVHALTVAWRGVLWVDVWKKGVLYCILSIPCFPAAHQYMTAWAYVTGVGLCVVGVLYGGMTFRGPDSKPVSSTREIDSRTYDRFDDVADIDDLEDAIVNPTVTIGPISVADQPEILNI